MADERQQHERCAETGQLGQLGLVERVDDRHERAAGVLLAHLGGGEVEPAEGAVLVVGEDLDLAGRRGDPCQGETLGVDQLDERGVGEVGRAASG